MVKLNKKACEGYSKTLKECLRPNRRVEISANGVAMNQQNTVAEGGPNGPTPLSKIILIN